MGSSCLPNCILGGNCKQLQVVYLTATEKLQEKQRIGKSKAIPLVGLETGTDLPQNNHVFSINILFFIKTLLFVASIFLGKTFSPPVCCSAFVSELIEICKLQISWGEKRVSCLKFSRLKVSGEAKLKIL